jgi:ABC-type uncharacterized transport system substrate-binding protein
MQWINPAGPARAKTHLRANSKTRRWARALGVTVLLSASLPSAALAHPHVWVKMKSEVIYAPDGRVTAIRHAWTFDDMFSAYAIQGLQSKEKGKFTRAELAPLAEVNVTSLKEYDFFTIVRAAGKKQPLSEPKKGEYWLDYTNATLTLHFTLALKTPVQAKNIEFETYDPTYFVDFGLAEKDPIGLAGAPAGCKLSIVKPKDLDASAGQKLGEAFFNQLTAASSWGAQFASKIFVQCP